MITLIAAAGEDNALGKGSQLLWHLPNDFKHFKSLTTGHCIIMGRKTFETFPKPLPQRTHIVITRQDDYLVPQGVYVAHSLPEALGIAAGIDSNPYVIGGGEIYAQALSYASAIELTRVHHSFPEADVFFPELDTTWELASTETFPPDERHAYSYTFERLIKT